MNLGAFPRAFSSAFAILCIILRERLNNTESVARGKTLCVCKS